MKRNKSALLILIVILGLSVMCLPACSSTIPITPVKQAAAATTAESVAAMSFEALGVEIDGAVYETYNEASDLLAALGEPVSFSEAPSCLFEGTDKTYEFENVVVYTITKNGVDLIDGIDLLTNKYMTRRGITVGSTKTSIIAAYGEPFSSDNDIVYLADPSHADSSATLTFIMDGDVVAVVSVYSGSNTTAS